MYYETRDEVLAWLDGVLTHRSASLRAQGLAMLEEVDCAPRRAWLERAEQDPDPSVSAVAILVGRIAHSPEDDLFEADFASSELSPGLEWEWEYAIKVCGPETIPRTVYLAWTKEEDDEAARAIALLKADAGKRAEDGGIPVIVRKRFVNRFTRSARGYSEALSWHRTGRPRYRDEESKQ
jgi:hypothetical protein